MSLTIALSKASGNPRYAQYSAWMRSLDFPLQTIDLSLLPLDQAIDQVHQAQGLILCGGEDIEPSRYGKSDDDRVCTCNPERDAAEWEYAHIAQRRNIPILGICRGMQLLNVYFGGTLIMDIPLSRRTAIEHGKTNNEDAWHSIEWQSTAQTIHLSTAEHRSVNSAHHQAIDVLAPSFRTLAYAENGIIEAVMSTDNSSFLLGVQWHPERMPRDLPLSRTIGERFIAAARAYASDA